MNRRKTNQTVVIRNKRRNNNKRYIPRPMPTVSTQLNMSEWSTFRQVGTTLNSGSASFNYFEYKLNSPYDLEAAVGGSNPINWQLNMQKYALCQVRTVIVTCRIRSREIDVNQRAFFLACDEQPSTTLTSYDRIINASENRRLSSKEVTVGNMNSPEVVIRKTYNLKRIRGAKAYEGDQNFYCPANSDPTQYIWGAFFIMNAEDGVYIPNGVNVDIRFDLLIDYSSSRLSSENTLTKKVPHRAPVVLLKPPQVQWAKMPIT